MNLPSKDRNGSSYLSYSQISLFKRSKEDYYNSYILKKPFEGNEYTDFGNKVGKALGGNDFSKFKDSEKNVLKNVTRLDQFETCVFLKYDQFYVIGFIDTNSTDMIRIIDYKTGGLKKEFQYQDEDYNQLQIYALAIRQEHGIVVQDASVEFIRRGGNAYRGQNLFVKEEQPIIIEQDLSEERLKSVYWGIIETAKQIEQFYKENQ